MKERLAALSGHVVELEEDLDTARRDLIKSEEVNTKLQRDVREVSDSGRGHAVVELNVGCLGGPLCMAVPPSAESGCLNLFFITLTFHSGTHVSICCAAGSWTDVGLPVGSAEGACWPPSLAFCPAAPRACS